MVFFYFTLLKWLMLQYSQSLSSLFKLNNNNQKCRFLWSSFSFSYFAAKQSFFPFVLPLLRENAQRPISWILWTHSTYIQGLGWFRWSHQNCQNGFTNELFSTFFLLFPLMAERLNVMQYFTDCNTSSLVNSPVVPLRRQWDATVCAHKAPKLKSKMPPRRVRFRKVRPKCSCLSEDRKKKLKWPYLFSSFFGNTGNSGSTVFLKLQPRVTRGYNIAVNMEQFVACEKCTCGAMDSCRTSPLIVLLQFHKNTHNVGV